jgi:hypothetical protein
MWQAENCPPVTMKMSAICTFAVRRRYLWVACTEAHNGGILFHIKKVNGDITLETTSDTFQ